MTFRTSARARMSDRKLIETHEAASAAYRAHIASIDKASYTGIANVGTIAAHPMTQPMLDEVNRLYRERCARGL